MRCRVLAGPLLAMPFAWNILSIACVAQTPEPAVAPPDGVHLRLEVKDGKTRFKMGEPIRPGADSLRRQPGV
jgi:hypothetical protein